MKYGIICAMEEEIRMLRDNLQNLQEQEYEKLFFIVDKLMTMRSFWLGQELGKFRPVL